MKKLIRVLKSFLKTYKYPLITVLVVNVVVISILFLNTNLFYKYNPTTKSPIYISQIFRWDAAWYRSIAEHGYTHKSSYSLESSIVFFPLYPMILKSFDLIFHSYWFETVAINELCLFIVSVFLYKLVLKLKFSETIAKNTLLLTLLSPFALFLYVPYSESLFLALLVCIFYLLECRKFFLAAILIGIATSLRSPALILVLIYILYVLETSLKNKSLLIKNKSITDLLIQVIKIKWLYYVPLTFIGILGYVLYLKFKFNDPFSFIWYEKAWGNTSVSFGNLFNQFKYLFTGLHHIILTPKDYSIKTYPQSLYNDTIHYINVLFLLLPLISIRWLFKRISFTYGAFIAIYVVSIISIAPSSGQSVGRYSLILFPFYIYLAYFANKYKITNYILILFIPLFVIQFILFINNLWIA